MPRQSAHEESSPPHTSHASYVAEPFGVPAQSAHDKPSPPHTPHASSDEHGNTTVTN